MSEANYGFPPSIVVEERHNAVDWLMIRAKNVDISVEPRPSYCDRGNWVAKVFPRGLLTLDAQDGWPRYYFDKGRALQEILAWLQKRKLVPEVELEGLIVGDELLVDGNAYTAGGAEWARLESVSPGSASVYPYKVLLSNGATGQYAPREILGRRRPQHLTGVIEETEADHPGFLDGLVESARWPR